MISIIKSVVAAREGIILVIFFDHAGGSDHADGSHLPERV